MGNEKNESAIAAMEDALGLSQNNDGGDNTAESIEESATATESDTTTQSVPVVLDTATLTDQSALTKEIVRIDLQIEELGKKTVDIESFYYNLESHLTEEEQALEFEDKSAYMKLVSEKVKAYEQNNSTADAIAKLEEEKRDLEGVLERRSALASVVSKYPNVKADEVFDYFENKLNKEQQGAILAKSTSYAEVYENTFKSFIESNPKNIQQQNSPKIPDINNVRKQDLNPQSVEDSFTSDEQRLHNALGI